LTVRILLALDDPELTASVGQSLRAMGAVMDQVNHAEMAQSAMGTNAPFEVVLLQAPSSTNQAQEQIKRFRSLAGTRGLMVLTGSQDETFKILALDAGADDVMATPLVIQEFEARMRALVRRYTGALNTLIHHGPLSFDQIGRVVRMGETMLELSARELRLLEVLLQRSGRMVSKDQLVEQLCQWGEEVSPNAIEVYIHRLRKKIEVDPIRILTVRGIGYCLEKINPSTVSLKAPETQSASDATHSLGSPKSMTAALEP
jgi:two-component system, OmpR family, response regulator